MLLPWLDQDQVESQAQQLFPLSEYVALLYRQAWKTKHD